MKARFASGHEIEVFDHRATAHNFERWEAPFVRMLMSRLRSDDVVYDVGAENGEFAALAAQVVGGSRIHLFEPSPTAWPNLRALWRANNLVVPGGCYPGFVADVTRPGTHWAPAEWRCCDGWPEVVNRPVTTETCFACFYERPDIPSTTLAEYASDPLTAPPTVLMVDVEGAEGLVLSTLGRLAVYPRLVFVSIHSQEFLAQYGREQDQERIFRLLSQLGYSAKFLGFDHEAHWIFER